MVYQFPMYLTQIDFFHSSIFDASFYKKSKTAMVLNDESCVDDIQKLTFDFLKSTEIEDIALIFENSSIEMKEKAILLHHIAHMSDNDIFNEILFEKAHNLSWEQLNLFYVQKCNEQYYYKQAFHKNLFVVPFELLERQTMINDELKLSYTEAFEFLLQLQSSATRAINVTSDGVLKEAYKNIACEYTLLVENYMKKLQDRI